MNNPVLNNQSVQQILAYLSWWPEEAIEKRLLPYVEGATMVFQAKKRIEEVTPKRNFTVIKGGRNA